MQYGGGGNLISNGFYSFSNPVFASLAGYSSMALFKMLGMSTYTMIQRFRTGNFATPEDDIYKQLMNQLGFSGSGMTGNKNDIVERVRNNHLNDLENIIPFVLIGIFYVGTRPKVDFALWHFRIFLLSRILHTIAYQVFSDIFLCYFLCIIRKYRFHYLNQHVQSRGY
jgi:glutathione S-transferase